MNVVDDKEKAREYIIFGAGHDGMELLTHIDKDKIAFICDNNPEKIKNNIKGIKTISFQKLVEIHDEYTIILAVSSQRDIVKRQFEKHGIDNYIEYVSEDYLKQDNVFTHDNFWVENSSMTKLIRKYILNSQEINWFDDYDNYCEIVKECVSELNGEYAFYPSRFDESHLYGYAKAMMDYAGISIDYHNFPIVSHGIAYLGTHPSFMTAAITCGKYDKQLHNDYYPYIPVFAVGPYIQYARGIYNIEAVKKQRQKNGRTALVFMDHGAEQTQYALTIENSSLYNSIVRLKNRYDKIIVCAYWINAGDEIYKMLHMAGVQVACCGFRFDEEFINRSRTLFDLADDVYVYGYTSALHSAIALHKPLFLFDLFSKSYSESLPSYVEYTDFYDAPEYDRYIHTINKGWGAEQLRELSHEEQDYINLHCGFDIKKSPDEIKTIYEISKSIWDNCDQNVLYYPIGVYKTYLQYQKDYDFKKLKCLTEAVGHKLWFQ